MQNTITLCGQEIARAGHICAFFDSRAEKYDVLAPYFSDGIANGDRIINVVEAKECDAHVRDLSNRDVPITKAIHRGQFSLMTAEETYLKDGATDLDGMLALLQETLESAKSGGHSVRTCGEMNWIGRGRLSPSKVMDYEARVNEFVPTFQCTLLCVYDIAAIPSGMVADILATHPTAIINGRLRPNPYSVEPSAFLDMLQQRERQQ